jgi:hypothetical protein
MGGGRGILPALFDEVGDTRGGRGMFPIVLLAAEVLDVTDDGGGSGTPLGPGLAYLSNDLPNDDDLSLTGLATLVLVNGTGFCNNFFGCC